MLKLYANPISPFAQRVMFFLEESEIPHEFVMLGISDLDKESFTKVSLFHTVPAIELNDFSTSESLTILRYLAQRFQKFSWYPENLEDRSRIDQIMEFGESIARPLMNIGKELAMAPQLGQVTNWVRVEELRGELFKYLPRFESYIAGKNYAFGPDLTIADAALTPFMHMYKYAQMSMTDYPETKAYADRMVERPAMKKVLAAVAEAFRIASQNKDQLQQRS